MYLQCIKLSVGILLLSAASQIASAGVWNVTHNASGNAFAQVFNGSSGDSDTDSTISVSDPKISAFAHDHTRLGSYGAGASSSARSSYTELESELSISQSVRTSYSSSYFTGGDGPGGKSNSDLTATIELFLPTELVVLQSILHERYGGPVPEVAINWNTIVKNITTGDTILSLDSLSPFTATPIQAKAGDKIRISTVANATLSNAPSGLRVSISNDYNLNMKFVVIPEPNTVVFMLTGAVFRCIFYRVF